MCRGVGETRILCASDSTTDCGKGNSQIADFSFRRASQRDDRRVIGQDPKADLIHTSGCVLHRLHLFFFRNDDFSCDNVSRTPTLSNRISFLRSGALLRWLSGGFVTV